LKHDKKPKLRIIGHSRQSHETEILLNKTTPLLFNRAFVAADTAKFQKPVFILISLHTLKVNLPIINKQHMLAYMNIHTSHIRQATLSCSTWLVINVLYCSDLLFLNY